MPLYHKSNLDDIFRRYRAFYEGGATGAMVFIRYITELENDPSIPKIRPLNLRNFDTELHDFLDACIAREDAIFARREDVEDDNIPSVQPRFGIGEHSAYLGGEVLMEEDTSYNTPFITDWSQTANLHTDPENIWFRRVIDGIRYIREHGGDRVAPRARRLQPGRPCELYPRERHVYGSVLISRRAARAPRALRRNRALVRRRADESPR